MFRDDFDAVFIGTGVWRPKKLGIKGEKSWKCSFCNRLFKTPKAYDLGKK